MKSEQERRSKKLTIRVTQKEFEQILAKARAQGDLVGTFTRKKILEALQ